MSNLNTGNFKVAISDDFTVDKSLNYKLWSATWGNANQYNFTGTSTGLVLSTSAAANWNGVGFMQSPNSPTTGEGYGLFSFTGNAGIAGQGVGICFCLWPADNKWDPASQTGKASEIDLLESMDGTKTGFSTLHYYSGGSANGQNSYTFANYDLTKSHTYSLDWEKGSLTFFVDGTELWQDTTHVPVDAADGGVNRSMGVELANASYGVTTPTVQLDVQKVTYSTSNGPNIIASSPGTLQEATVGAGVTFNQTITATGLSTVYAEVLTSSGAVESAYQAVALNSVGVGTASIHLANTGDYVKVADNATSPLVTATSGAVTITDVPIMSLSAPGTVPGIYVGAGATVTETVNTTYFTGKTIYEEVLTSSGAVETGYQAVTLTNGSATSSVHFNQTGDYIKAVDNTTSPKMTAISGAVTITPPPAITSPFISITSLSEDAGRLLMGGDKEIGKLASIKEFMDGKYLGILRSSFQDGPFSMHIADVAAGAHVLSLGLDVSTATASYSFTKQVDGSVVQNPITTSTASLLAGSTLGHNSLFAHAA